MQNMYLHGVLKIFVHNDGNDHKNMDLTKNMCIS